MDKKSMVSDKDRFIEFLDLAGLEKFDFEKLGFLYGRFFNKKLIHIDIQTMHNPIIPDMIGEFTSLESIWLGDDWKMNDFVSLPESIGNLSHLRELIINNSNISKFPESFSNLKSLEVIELRNANLSLLPDFFGNFTQLTELDLYNNKLSDIPTTFLNLKNLKYLNFSLNKFKIIPEIICSLSSLESLNFSSNFLKSIPNCIFNLTNLTEFNIDYNFIQEFSIIKELEREFSSLNIYYHTQNPKDNNDY